MSRPSAIPEDVMKAAHAVVRGLWDRDRDSGENAEAIARAIMSERERAAKIADAEVERHRLNYEHNGRQPLDLYYETAATNVAAAIRNGTP